MTHPLSSLHLLCALGIFFAFAGCTGGSPRFEKVKSMHIDHVIYFVNDLERAKRFYQNVLGLEMIDAFPGFVRMRVGDQWIGLHLTEMNGEDVGKGPMLYLRVEDISQTLARLSKAGAKSVTQLTDVPTGKIVTISDSEGNAIGLYEEAK